MSLGVGQTCTLAEGTGSAIGVFYGITKGLYNQKAQKMEICRTGLFNIVSGRTAFGILLYLGLLGVAVRWNLETGKE
jgi:hypothetical protein